MDRDWEALPFDRDSLARHLTSLGGPFLGLYSLVWDHHARITVDEEPLAVVQPFFAWRAQALASPVGCPTVERSVRATLFRYVENVLDTTRFDPSRTIATWPVRRAI